MPASSSPAIEGGRVLFADRAVTVPDGLDVRLAQVLGLPAAAGQPLTLPVLVGSDELRAPLVDWAQGRGALPVHVREVIVLRGPLQPGASYSLSAAINEIGPAAELVATLTDPRDGSLVARHEARVVGSERLTPAASRNAAAPPDPHAVPAGTVTPEHVAAYAAVSGDDNPVHTDAEAARALGLAAPIAHGMYLMGLMQRALDPVTYPCRFEAQFVSPATLGTALYLSRAERDGPSGPATRLRLADGEGRNIVLAIVQSGEAAVR